MWNLEPVHSLSASLIILVCCDLAMRDVISRFKLARRSYNLLRYHVWMRGKRDAILLRACCSLFARCYETIP